MDGTKVSLALEIVEARREHYAKMYSELSFKYDTEWTARLLDLWFKYEILNR